MNDPGNPLESRLRAKDGGGHNGRRNELSGNTAPSQEPCLIEKIDEPVDELGEGENPKNKRLGLPGEVGKEYKHTEVRRIGMSPEMSQSLDFA